MRVYIVTDSSVYEKRAELVRDFYAEQGLRTTLIVSDFNHMAKRKLSADEKKTDRIYIDAKTYDKNISPKRLYYHYDFAKKVYKLLKRMVDADIEEGVAEPSDGRTKNSFNASERDKGKEDFRKRGANKALLYMLIPGNSLAETGARLKKETGCRLVTDIIDLWPESLPVKKIEGLPPIRFWKGIRDKSLKAADHIVTECELYKRILRLKDAKTSVIYWPKQEKVELLEKGSKQMCFADRTGTEELKGQKKKDAGAEKVCENSTDEISIAYIGSINNIIDIPEIISVLEAVNKRRRVSLCVIGDGESREEFLKALTDAGISFIYHGAVYDEAKKQELLQACEWGLNIMKPTVRVGLTMKSTDYLANGLKLINSIEGDTRELVDKYGLGVNICEYAAKKTDGSYYSDSWEAAAERIASYKGADREYIHEFFKANFSVEAMYNKMREIAPYV